MPHTPATILFIQEYLTQTELFGKKNCSKHCSKPQTTHVVVTWFKSLIKMSFLSFNPILPQNILCSATNEF